MTVHPAYRTARRVTERASVVLAANPSPMTLDGTNTWLLGERGAVVVDPGPDDAEHVDLVVAAAPAVRLVLITHGHGDHTAGSRLLHELTGAPVRALDQRHCIDGQPLVDSERIEVGDVRLEVLATPGHTADSVCLRLPGDGGVLTGDTVLGRGTTVIMPGDGDLGDHLDSLNRLSALPARTPVLPGHGPDLPDLAATARQYLRHREQRLEQVRAALRRLGAEATPRQVVELVYVDVDRQLWPAAELSVRAQLDYLRR
ncbi:MAG TPA: MBL fold metallo-hydrolase [Pseudonocardiaceae bacterium]|nr:MBL fold metallo-hydrolase [Pseudonocardiaceae bacterium]